MPMNTGVTIKQFTQRTESANDIETIRNDQIHFQHGDIITEVTVICVEPLEPEITDSSSFTCRQM